MLRDFVTGRSTGQCSLRTNTHWRSLLTDKNFQLLPKKKGNGYLGHFPTSKFPVVRRSPPPGKQVLFGNRNKNHGDIIATAAFFRQFDGIGGSFFTGSLSLETFS
jgi:hypothetical protein